MTLGHRRWLPVALVAAVAGFPASLTAQALDSITPPTMRRHIMRLAADSMRGRATPSPQLEQAARYAAGLFRRAGLVPLGDGGTYLQRYPIWTTRLVPESSTVELLGPASGRWRLGQDVDWLRGTEVSPPELVGPAVVLTGIPDSTRPFGNLDVRGAIVIHLAPMTATGGAEAPFWLFRAAERAGVIGWIQVVQRDSADWQTLLSRIRQPRILLSRSRDVLPFPVLEMRDESIGRFLAELGIEEAGVRPLPAPPPAARLLRDYAVRFRLRERVLTRRSAPNVIGLLPGADTTQRGYVLVTAHLDGLGVGPRIGGDSVYNGADDDATGTAAVLEAARALARGGSPRPARGIVFALFSGTERELWGSAYYLTHPPVPLAQTSAVIDVEAIGRNLKDSVSVGHGPTPTALTGAVERVAQAHSAELGLTIVSDVQPKLRLWLEGDHAAFFERGIPILYLHNGLHGDLHRPGDEPQKIQFESTARIGRFLALLAHEVATPTT